MDISNNKEIIETFNILYNNISSFIKKDDINIFNVIDPIKNYGTRKLIFPNISSKTIIKNIEDDNIIDLNDIKNKTFNMYPILCILNMNIYNEDLYINLFYHTIFIKITDGINLDIDYNNIKKLMN